MTSKYKHTHSHKRREIIIFSFINNSHKLVLLYTINLVALVQSAEIESTKFWKMGGPNFTLSHIISKFPKWPEKEGDPQNDQLRKGIPQNNQVGKGPQNNQLGKGIAKMTS